MRSRILWKGIDHAARRFLAAAVTAAALTGCSRVGDEEAPLTYVAGQAVVELPDLHRQQINETLLRYYGTPTQPVLRVPDFEAEPDDDSGEIPLIDGVAPDRLRHGAAVYRRRCAGCHGVTGDGAGPAAEYLNPKPRDYRRGVFKFTSTPYGAKPRRSDLVRTIRRGAKGTSMPAFAFLPDGDVEDVVDYVIVLSQRGQMEESLAREARDYEEDEALELEIAADLSEKLARQWRQAEEKIVLPATPPPLRTRQTIAAGRKAFLNETYGCWKCHGTDGQGQTEWLSRQFIERQESLPDTERIKINYDVWGNVAPAADLTAGMFHGGRRPLDIYRRIYSGINGTPMPGFGEALANEPETIWHLVHFVLAVAEGSEPATAGTEEP